jgi:hypothetical protein
VDAAQWATAANYIAARWEHGHDGLTPDCALCHAEYAEVRALINHHRTGVPMRTLPHPVTITTNERGETERAWSCPASCPTPGDCVTIHDLRLGAYADQLGGLPNGEYVVGRDWCGVDVTHPDGTAVMLPSAEPMVSAYTVGLLHDDDPAKCLFTITVQERRDGTWAVMNGEVTYLDDDLNWSDGMGHGDGWDDWAVRHLFDLDTALGLAQKAAPAVTVNGVTALQAWTHWDNERRLTHILGKDAVEPLRPYFTRKGIDGPDPMADAVAVVTALTPQMANRDALTLWLTTPRYPSANGPQTALQEIAAGRGPQILGQLNSAAATDGETA